MTEPSPPPGGSGSWSFPLDRPDPEEPRDSRPGRAAAAAALASRWSPSLSPSVPPPPPPAIPRAVRRLARRALALGVAVPLVLEAGTAIGAWLAPEARVELDTALRTVEVRASTDGRFWGLPPNDFVRVPETRDRR